MSLEIFIICFMSDISTCKHPLKGFYIGINPDTGNNLLKITDYACKYLWKPTPKDDWIKMYDDCDDFIDSNGKRTIHGIIKKDFVEIPCGRCVACRLKKSRVWADRCMLELPYHKHSYFVTLTYDDEHVPTTEPLFENGFVIENMTLDKTDLQKFFKRLRIQYERKGYTNKLKYYACGEYGENTYRPHYHAIIFGLELDDLKVVTQSKLGFNYYSSDWLSKIWTYGHITIADVSWDTCAYVARYILKKHLGADADFYDDLNIDSEFTTMSNGIGQDYYNEYKDRIYQLDSISVSTPKGARNIKPPKYFDSLLEKEDASLLEEIKTVRRNVAEMKKKTMLSQTDRDYLDILETEERLLLNRIKMLKRKEI